jgi:hypothetical protein
MEKTSLENVLFFFLRIPFFFFYHWREALREDKKISLYSAEQTENV